MLSFSVNSDLTKRLKTLQSAIAEKFSEIKNLPKDELAFIHRFARISMIGASTRIENAILTDSEISWLDEILSADGKTTSFQEKQQIIEDKLSKDRERSIEEVAGCRAMLSLIYEQAKDMIPLTESQIRGLHAELLRHYKKAGHYKGQYKKNPNSVVEINHKTKAQREVFKTADPGPITEAAMSDLAQWYNQALHDEPWSVAVACEFVFRFLAIHPFQDGNGRLGRGLFLLTLLQCPDPHIAFVAEYLAIDRQIEKHKEDYYHVLNRCSNGKFKADPKKYHIEHFLNFMIKVLVEAVADIEFYQKKFHAFNQLSGKASKVLECFKEEPEIKLQLKDIIESTNFPRRTVANALTTLLQGGFIQKYGKGSAVRYQIVF
ncbi:MAG: Fic family protein [Deltaproteobacteria bacterium]|nr:Fic family protein [Deltaproteobacteria bacterium]